MEFWKVESDDSMQEGLFGIPEPKTESSSFREEDAAQTVVLVPGLSFSHKGYRLGRGKGYFDTFLGRQSMGDAILVGVCFELQFLEKVPYDKFDIAVQYICTEEGIREL